jgi:hypothetical protein
MTLEEQIANLKVEVAVLTKLVDRCLNVIGQCAVAEKTAEKAFQLATDALTFVQQAPPFPVDEMEVPLDPTSSPRINIRELRAKSTSTSTDEKLSKELEGEDVSN